MGTLLEVAGVCPVKREAAEELFKLVDKNTDFFGDFRRALGKLDPQEQPKMVAIHTPH